MPERTPEVVYEERIRSLVLEAEELAKRARRRVDQAREAGLDVSAAERDLIAHEARIARMKAVYVPKASK